MPNGEKLRPKQMDQLPLENFENSRDRLPLENFENSRARTFDLSKYSSKFGLLWGESMIMGKRGSF
jgi:hypothetical protein